MLREACKVKMLIFEMSFGEREAFDYWQKSYRNTQNLNKLTGVNQNALGYLRVRVEHKK